MMDYLTLLIELIKGVFLGGISTSEAFGIDLNVVWGAVRTGLIILAAWAIARYIPVPMVLGIVFIASVTEFGRRFIKDYTDNLF